MSYPSVILVADELLILHNFTENITVEGSVELNFGNETITLENVGFEFHK